MKIFGNQYDKAEFAGAFGDLGTLVPFIVGYITLNKMDPLGILVSLGLFKIFAGLYFRTPIPIQPMKAIGGMAIAHASSITHGMIWAAGIFTGVFWLLMGLTGAVTWIEKITAKPVVRGIMLGLGLSFIMEGLNMMRTQPLFAIGGAVLTLLLLNSRRFPAILALLVYGIIVAFVHDPGLPGELADISVRFRWPQIGLPRFSWNELVTGLLLLGLPQAPLTLGNAVIGTVAENNQHFPDRPVTAKKISIGHGIMNMISPFLGGIPVCHGAGGMAGHIRFGARTGGSLVILGLIILFAGLFLSSSISLIIQVFPRSVLGVIMLFAGVELSMVIRDVGLKKENLFVLVVTTGIAMWNMGVAYLAGLILYHAIERKWIKI